MFVSRRTVICWPVHLLNQAIREWTQLESACVWHKHTHLITALRQVVEVVQISLPSYHMITSGHATSQGCCVVIAWMASVLYWVNMISSAGTALHQRQTVCRVPVIVKGSSLVSIFLTTMRWGVVLDMMVSDGTINGLIFFTNATKECLVVNIWPLTQFDFRT